MATVLLEHREEDGSVHYDWMVERGGALITFRVMERIDLGVPAFGAVRLADHRVAYLTYEGPVSGGRGEVRRVAEGRVELEADLEDAFRATGHLGGARGLFCGRQTDGSSWRFEFTGGG